VGGVGDKLSVNAPDANGSEGAVPGDITDDQSGGSADDAEDIGIIFSVGAEENALDLDLVVPTFGKQGSNGAIGQAAGEDFLFRGTPFAFEVATGETAGGGSFLAVIYRQGEKLLTCLGFGGGDGGHDDDGFAELNGDCAIGLLGDFAGFDCDLFVTDLSTDFFWHN
jgi:hypothetical protein